MISSVSVLFLYHDARVCLWLWVTINLNQVFSTLINLFVLSSIKMMFCYMKNTGNEHYQSLWCMSVTEGTRIKPFIIVWKKKNIFPSQHEPPNTTLIFYISVNTVRSSYDACWFSLRFHSVSLYEDILSCHNKLVWSMCLTHCEYTSRFILRCPQALSGKNVQCFQTVTRTNYEEEAIEVRCRCLVYVSNKITQTHYSTKAVMAIVVFKYWKLKWEHVERGSVD